MDEAIMRSDLPTFTPDDGKILEAILLLIEEAEARNFELTQYDIVKSVFLADERHLDEQGRPVTFDNYKAMEHGPVPDRTYDMLSPGFDWARLGLAGAPWLRTASKRRKAFFTRPARAANRRRLSGTDVDALVDALVRVKTLGFRKVRQLTHRHPAYLAAWGAGEAKSAHIDLRLIPGWRDPDLIDDLVFASSCAG